MNTAHRPRRLAATLLAVTLAGAGLTVAVAPAAHAAASDAVIKLPFSSYSAIAVDSVHQRVFVADSNTDYYLNKGIIAVYDFQGERITTIQTPAHVSGLALNADSTKLYAGLREQIQTYDTTTFEPALLSYTNTDTCGRELAFSGGQLYFTTPYSQFVGACSTAQTYLDGIVNGVHTRTGWNDYGKIKLESGPGDRMLMGQPRNDNAANPFLAVYDTSNGSLVRNAARRFADGAGHGALDLKDMAFSADGGKVAVADAAYGTRLLNTDDLTDAANGYQALPAGATASSVAFSADGKYVARGAAATGATPDLLVQPADPTDSTAPLEFVFEGSLDGDRVAPRGMEWSADGSRLFAVTTNAAGGQYWLHIIQPPAVQYDTRFTGGLTHSPAQAVAGEPLAVRGKLESDGPAPGTPLKVRATRTDATGTHDLGSATVKEDGTFTVLDEPDLVGDATYKVSFLGDLTHRPAEDLTHTVTVGKAPTSIALTAPEKATLSGGITITGTFSAQGKALPDKAVLKVVRTDRLGTGTLSSVTVGADGTVTINDIPRTRREVTYTVSWPGDDLHTSSTASATVYVTR
ncbi:Ig-like domain repeat protein [Streptomyces olivochromogenes]|uniref:Ig-like domain repeat protein n=1 Tax=Streptomyces olivochromogenes TaxID=1963 RepID=UPI001F1A4DD6|nr:Ig-like domain repeat protein [Streptomyces olivochromogenes]MCF3131134.1 Ig-like domain repeat protein [Streptomyces olivochromogenes]